HLYLEGKGRSSPVVVAVHGRGGNARSMSPFFRVFPRDAHIISLEAPFPDPDIGGMCWWLMEESMSKRKYEKIGGLLLKETDRLVSEYGLSKDSLFCIGFSQGGAILSVALQLNPCYFKKAALLASFTVRVDPPLPPSKDIEAKGAEVLIIAGTKDEFVPLEMAQSGAVYLSEKGFKVSLFVEDIGHKVGRRGMARLRDFFA
ncbi:MAG: hypothetical protein D6808_00505, partial [Candidatus Dadabacteria bacterium]